MATNINLIIYIDISYIAYIHKAAFGNIHEHTSQVPDIQPHTQGRFLILGWKA